MNYILYQITAWALFLLVFPVFLIYTLSGPGHELRQRLGFPPRTPRPPGKRQRIWLHAASVGEVRVARALVEELGRQLPAVEIWVSTLTRHGHQVCREWMPEEVTSIFAPLDLTGPVEHALKTIEPDLYVCLETELWPGVIRQAARRGAGPLLLNARLSDNSLHRYGRWPAAGLIKETLTSFQAIATISEEEARRYRDLGAPPEKVSVCGNAKYDLELSGRQVPEKFSAAGSETTAPVAECHRRRAELGIAANQPVLVAGSTHSGEEELLVAAWRRLKRQLPGLVLILAPRHLRRLAEIEHFFQERDIIFHLLSEELPAADNAPAPAPADGQPAASVYRRQGMVLLVDRLGELAGLYALADYVFCGGSLVKRGGHNILEAAAWGKPVLFGPFMDDFQEEADLLLHSGGGFTVRDDEDICQRIMAFHTRPAEYRLAASRAQEIARSLQGASRRQVALIKYHLGYQLGQQVQDHP